MVDVGAAAHGVRSVADGAVGGDGVLIDSVCKSYGQGSTRHLVLSEVSLAIGRGEFVSVIGPSGCGKTTLLRLVAGLTSSDSGRILIDGESVAQARAGKALGLVPQEPALLPWLDVLGNVRLPLRINRKANAGRELRDPVETLEAMGLTGDVLSRYPAQLSGGMQQRVAIARAYVFNPNVLLMDEPFSALDELNRDQQRMNLLEFWQTHRKSVLFVTHSVPEAVILSDRIVVMGARPGAIKAVVDVDLPRPRSWDSLNDPAFHRVEHEVRDLLRSAAKS